ncbi:hypothetical protein ARTSIC4J27_808 [Pseudarthrobacter siccitolerans]|uniref:Uncharacterized protein n=1 Tax=Pseudarthrobacter siccitolerans TaxID=861266 RepID=A0A024GYN4_9MICC|nr:hypothetical protein ARTSIC4J27_808 [Pseudarthrobacter siccitolerans]
MCNGHGFSLSPHIPLHCRNSIAGGFRGRLEYSVCLNFYFGAPK